MCRVRTAVTGSTAGTSAMRGYRIAALADETLDESTDSGLHNLVPGRITERLSEYS